MLINETYAMIAQNLMTIAERTFEDLKIFLRYINVYIFFTGVLLQFCMLALRPTNCEHQTI